jgi:hypothetical protein
MKHAITTAPAHLATRPTYVYMAHVALSTHMARASSFSCRSSQSPLPSSVTGARHPTWPPPLREVKHHPCCLPSSTEMAPPHCLLPDFLASRNWCHEDSTIVGRFLTGLPPLLGLCPYKKGYDSPSHLPNSSPPLPRPLLAQSIVPTNSTRRHRPTSPPVQSVTPATKTRCW